MKRFTIVAIVVLVALIVVPAAFAGLRPIGMGPPVNPPDAFTPTTTCRSCHDAFPADLVHVVTDWQATAHASVANNTEQSGEAGCAGCHSGNFDPAQAISWDEDPGSPTYGQGDNPTEALVGCPACHYNGVTTHKGSADWNAGNPDFSPLDYGQFANPEVCGQCHDQRGRAKSTYSVYTTEDAQGNPIDPPILVDTLLRFWPPFDPYTAALTDVINVGSELPTWTGGYAKNIHDTGAVQYDEMLATGGHFESWDALMGLVNADIIDSNTAVNECGHCMSADQRILVEAGKLNVDPENPTSTPTDSEQNPVTADELKYGVTCVACHDPHKRSPSNSVWGGEHEGDATERNAQLIEQNPGTDEVLTRATLCGSCHNGHLAAGETAFAPGAEINHPTKEFMDGIGAIDVPQMPALHKGFCVQCHMVPTATNTTYAANHVFTPIMPETAMNNTLGGAAPIAGTTGTGSPGASAEGTTVTITVTRGLDWSADAVGKMVTITGVAEAGYNGTFAVTSIISNTKFTYENPTSDLPDSGAVPAGSANVTFSDMPTDLHMPYSACSTCHEGTNGDNAAKTEALQEIIDQRQQWTHDMVDAVMATLDAKAVANGFTDAEDAIAQGFGQSDLDFGKAWTNMELVAQEGSWGVHNWQYGVAVINKAMEQAGAVRIPASLDLKVSASKITYGGTVTLSGTVTASGPALQEGDQVRLWANGAATSSYATLSANDYTFANLKPSRNTTYRVQFLGDVNYRQALSNTAPVDVAFKVTLKASKTTLAAGTKLTLSGTVAPIAGPVNIQRFVNGNWQTFKNGNVVNSSGKFSYTFTIKKGSYSFRAVKSATATNLKGASSTVKVTAK